MRCDLFSTQQVTIAPRNGHNLAVTNPVHNVDRVNYSIRKKQLQNGDMRESLAAVPKKDCNWSEIYLGIA